MRPLVGYQMATRRLPRVRYNATGMLPSCYYVATLLLLGATGELPWGLLDCHWYAARRLLWGYLAATRRLLGGYQGATRMLLVGYYAATMGLLCGY